MTGYVCHKAHGAAVTTVVQFNSILLAVATRLGALNLAYLLTPNIFVESWTTRTAARVAHRTWRAHRSLYVAVRRGARYHLEDCALRSGHSGSLCGENGSAESMQDPVQQRFSLTDCPGK